MRLDRSTYRKLGIAVSGWKNAASRTQWEPPKDNRWAEMKRRADLVFRAEFNTCRPTPDTALAQSINILREAYKEGHITEAQVRDLYVRLCNAHRPTRCSEDMSKRRQKLAMIKEYYRRGDITLAQYQDLRTKA